MSELNQEELLDIFDGVFSFYLGELGHEEDKPRIRQAYQQIKEMIQKPEVTEGFVEKWADKLSGYYKPRDSIVQMLKEAGVEVVGK